MFHDCNVESDNCRLYPACSFICPDNCESLNEAAFEKRSDSNMLSGVRETSRHGDDSFEMDLTYITDRIIAISFPSNGQDLTYLHGLESVASMLKQKHDERYMIFNISERRYDISNFNDQVLDFGWPDHLAPSLVSLVSLINCIDSWLRANNQNVAVLHCKGGKDRIGVVISAYIQFNKASPSPQAALDWFALRRFYDTKFGGVTHPSQKRYVNYFRDLLENRLRIRNRVLLLSRIILHGVPNFDGKGGCKPLIKLYQDHKLFYTNEVYSTDQRCDEISLNFGLLALTGDIMVKCCQQSIIPALQHTIFRCQFHIDAVDQFRLILQKKELDEACKDRRFPKHGFVELIFDQADKYANEYRGNNIWTVFESLSTDSGIESPTKVSSEKATTGLHSAFMESEVIAKTFSVPRHIPGPIDGNPYALVDRKLFGSARTEKTVAKEMHKSSDSYKSVDISKGINDLDNLLSQLGFLSNSCRNDVAERMERDENSNLTLTSNNDTGMMITTRLPTINVVAMESSSDNNLCHESMMTQSNRTDRKELNEKVVSEIRVKPRLPARTSSFGAVNRHQKGHFGRTMSEDGKKEMQSSEISWLNINRNESTGSDDVFDPDGPLSPTVSEMLNELTNSPLSTRNSQQHWETKRSHNFSGRYDNCSEKSMNEINCNDCDPGEFRQGRVKDHVKQFNRIVTFPDPSKVSTGVPMPGLVQGVNCEDKISEFNYRSLAPGQRGPTLDRIFISGSPPKRVVYDTEKEQQTSPILEAEELFIPSYADQSIEYYLHRREQLKQEPGMRLNNGQVPLDDTSDEAANSNKAKPLKQKDLTVDSKGDCQLDDERSDSAYGESTKSLSTVSIPAAANSSTLVINSKDDQRKSCNRASHGSSVSSLNDEDSSGYARIEDIRLMKRSFNTSSPPVIVEPKAEIIQEQEVIAVSHVAALESFPDKLNKRLPEIISNKDLSLAVYQTNYLPGFTNGQPKLMPNNQIDIEDGRSTIHGRRFESASTPINGTVIPDQTQVASDGSSKKVSCASSEGGLGPGIHLVESPPSPCHSGKSDSSSTTHSPARKTVRHRMKRSNSSTSSLSSSELFPEGVRHHHVKFDRDTLGFWYKPKITRDEAIAMLKDKAPGTFVVRDSQSYEGAFGLAVKVVTPPLGVFQQAGGDITKINMESELIRHFLIEPCKQGVRLKGSNSEPAFPSLVALIYQHSVTKMALPIELVLPTEDIQNCDEIDGKNSLTEQQVLQNGAACNLVYLASIDVEGLSGDGAVKYAINKVLSSSHALKSTVVKIKVDQDGITLTDMDRKIFFRKHYAVTDVLHCMMDPRGRRFNLQTLLSDVSHQAPCFGVVVSKPQKPLEHECIVFAEIEPSQPASAVIDFVQRVIKNVNK